MSVFISAAVAVFKAIAAIPKIVEYCKQFADEIILWRITSYNTTTHKAIMDAAAFAARAKTKEDREKALDMWSDALSRPRKSR